MEGGSLEQMIKQNADGCEDEGLLREICHNILRVSKDRLKMQNDDDDGADDVDDDECMVLVVLGPASSSSTQLFTSRCEAR